MTAHRGLANGNGFGDDGDGRLDEIREDVRLATAAARTAANAALEASASCSALRREMLDALAQQTGEIIRLVRSDGAQQERLDAFDEHVRACTDQATQTIVAAGTRAGRGLSSRVMVPVGAVSAAAAIVQWILQHWHP